MTQFLPAPLLMHAWRNERSLKENNLVKCIHYTGEEKKGTTCLLVFWRCLWRCLQRCTRRCLHTQIFDHSVLYHSSYSATTLLKHRYQIYYQTWIIAQFSGLRSSTSIYQSFFKFNSCFSPSPIFPPPPVASSSETGKHFPRWFALSPICSFSSCRQSGLFNHCQSCISLLIFLLLPGLL